MSLSARSSAERRMSSLLAEVVGERAGRVPGLGGDLADRGGVDADAVDHPPGRFDQLLPSDLVIDDLRQLDPSCAHRANRLTVTVPTASLNTDVRNRTSGVVHHTETGGWDERSYGHQTASMDGSRPRLRCSRCAACGDDDDGGGGAAPGDRTARRPRRRRRAAAPTRPTGATTAGQRRWRRRRGARADHRPRHGPHHARPVAGLLRHVPDLPVGRVPDAHRRRPDRPHEAAAAPRHEVGGQRRQHRVHVHPRPEGGVRRRLAGDRRRRQVLVGAPGRAGGLGLLPDGRREVGRGARRPAPSSPRSRRRTRRSSTSSARRT